MEQICAMKVKSAPEIFGKSADSCSIFCFLARGGHSSCCRSNSSANITFLCFQKVFIMAKVEFHRVGTDCF